MRSAFAPIAFAALAAAAPQNSAPSSLNLKPSEPNPSDCQSTYNGNFVFGTVNTTSSSKRSLFARADGFTLKDGIFRDSKDRVGSIVANKQFQFDPENGQAGAIYNAGWAICPNGTIALGGSTIFQNCLSGDFYNIYRGNNAPQCHDVYLVVAGAGGAPAASPTSGSGGTGQQPDGQPTGGPGASQIADGQVQAPMATQGSDGQVMAPAHPASQIGDGQVQAPTAAATASQIGDGQVQAPTASQIGDGQVQAPTAAPTASQIGDGQVQAPVATASQIGDGQVQAPRPAPAAGNGTSSSTPAPYTGAGSAVRGDLMALAGAGLMAVLLL